MSADNGIYILVSPVRGSTDIEYRVAHGQAIENLDFYFPETEEWKQMHRSYFGNSKIFLNEDNAYLEARRIDKEIRESGFWTEYGICLIESLYPFPRE